MFKKLFGHLADSNEKEIERLQPLVDKINGLEAEFEALFDADLRGKTDEFRKRLAVGESLDDLLPEAFAAVREAARRTLGLRHYDVQLIGGVVLHQGKIAEMKTGEGKTLVATLPLYLNSLTGKGCHLITVNDYLARRDPYWMGPVYHALGVKVASIYPMQNPAEHTPARLYDPEFDSGDERDPWRHFRPIPRGEAYQADITYGTSSEFGFDYLRDNMVMDLKRCVQGDLEFGIVDEIDNLLIDEARTPLIISGPDEEAGKLYPIFASLVPRLKPEADYEIDEKARTATLTEEGISNVERMLSREGLLKSPNLYDPLNHSLIRHLDSALKAHTSYKRDVDYVVKDGEVIIVDQFTGRLMVGRRYSEGIHQAIEAKERVKIQRETKTFATITIQNYFRMYHKLAGMTGTAVTEAEEFHKIYDLEVVVIPTNKPMLREDKPDIIYKDEKGKFKAVVTEIDALHKENVPVLVGTVSIEKSEHLADQLTRKGIKYQVLNAKQHEREAGIIADAGKPGAVTVATNMAGRGVDIVLGGKEPPHENKKEWEEWRKRHELVLELGGLHVIATERHEARRIDNQLRGRAGRQGDPGLTRFYVSLEDDIVRRFGGDRIKGFMEWAGMDEDTPIENKMVNRAIESSQTRVEGFHFDMRKHLVEYDDVVNKHRELIYAERRKILDGGNLKDNVLEMVRQEIRNEVAEHLPDEHGVDWNTEGLLRIVATIFPLPPDITAESLASLSREDIAGRLIAAAEDLYEAREQEMGSEPMRILERLVMLRTLDTLWIDHLTVMEERRREAGWQSLRQVRSLDAYKSLGYEQFQDFLDTIQHDVVHAIYHLTIKKREAPSPSPAAANATAGRGAPVAAATKEAQPKLESPMTQVTPGGNARAAQKAPVGAGGRKVGRNDPCPCGSGKKYKKCCGK